MTVDAIELQVFVSGTAPLARFDQIASELEARGLVLRARHPGLGIIIGTTADRSMASRLEIAGVTGVRISERP
jgi:hypothetical protein